MIFLNANVPQSKIVSSTAWQLIRRKIINFYLHCQIYNSSLQIIIVTQTECNFKISLTQEVILYFQTEI